MNELIIATRESPLALWQAEHVAARLRHLHPQLPIRLLGMTTQGDRLLQQPLAKIGGKGLFIKELEHALLEGRAHIAVHSMKDVGVEFPQGLGIHAILQRENPADAFVSPRYARFDDLPQGARVGTCSLRRRLHLARLRPDLYLCDLRGNVQTRLRKLDEGHFDAIILAAAGLLRLELADRIRHFLPLEAFIPAIGQGAIGVECRDEDAEVRALLHDLHDEETALCVRCERQINRALQGNCQVPIAAHAQLHNAQVYLHARVGMPDASKVVEAQDSATLAEAETMAERLAQELIARGARDILRACLNE